MDGKKEAMSLATNKFGAAGTLRDHDEMSAREWIEHYLLDVVPAWEPGAARSVDRVRAMLNLLSNLQDRLRVVHVAGTAGKGTVCASLTAVLSAHGVHVGTYTSPHVHDILERFAIGGVPASPILVLASLKKSVRQSISCLTDRWEPQLSSTSLRLQPINCSLTPRSTTR